MNRIEITYRSNANELVKLNERLEKAEKVLAKKQIIAEKLGVADMDGEQHREWLATVPIQDGWIINKEDIKKNGAWFDLYRAEDRVAEIQKSIAYAEKKFAEAEKKLDEYHAELEKIEDLKMKEEMWKLEFEAEQKEWAKDGITLNGRYWGLTPNDKTFYIHRNHGFTERSLHCFTLIVDGKTIFTSGEFWRAYGVIKNS